MYRSAPYLKEFYERVRASAIEITPDYEIVFVNDGSPDDSLEVAVGIHRFDPRVKVVDLSRNFGHHKAMMTGLAQSSGDLVFLIDCDLEEETRTLEDLSRKTGAIRRRCGLRCSSLSERGILGTNHRPGFLCPLQRALFGPPSAECIDRPSDVTALCRLPASVSRTRVTHRWPVGHHRV
jgi:glycosyltransferase involved in cell wall biosynthesis